MASIWQTSYIYSVKHIAEILADESLTDASAFLWI